ncbi:sporulation inhibitor of replication protein SirA [Filobacillus milosensis]|uniref:Sporulation inhibitor of replication protein SirA n=1 Tax=Filobacillus milosensis TaxID=94137 RepID=A0A4Y8IR87_9BACI|nr:sporulation inhibitor of replication protein SirA [Filobacillus milosensis]TFB23122.1 sporulation inhibitor of replication protein SirA [Filobacillus milosensis]
MYQYSLYLLKSDYAKHFYYKIDTVYRFLYEQMIECPQDSKEQYKLVLDKLNSKDLFLHMNYWKDESIDVEMKRNHLTVTSNGQQMFIKVEDYVINIHTQSIVDLDRLLFQYLKTFHPHIFAVNYETLECGWITPFVGKEIYSL